MYIFMYIFIWWFLMVINGYLFDDVFDREVGFVDCFNDEFVVKSWFGGFGYKYLFVGKRIKNLIYVI